MAACSRSTDKKWPHLGTACDREHQKQGGGSGAQHAKYGLTWLQHTTESIQNKDGVARLCISNMASRGCSMRHTASAWGTGNLATSTGKAMSTPAAKLR